MKIVRASCVLSTSMALLSSSVLHAQARGVPSRPPGAATTSEAQDATDPGKPADSYPCPWTVTDQSTYKWWSTAWNTICDGKARSLAVALAFAQGLDERGGRLDAGARAGKLGEMESWLRHLAGKFPIEGERWNASGKTSVRGTADCFGIGDGPGVSCLISATWKSGKDDGRDTNRTPTSNYAVRPQVLLFGLDPGAMQIRVTHVDSLAIAMRGFLLDGAVILEPLSLPEIVTVNRALIDPFLSSSSRGSPDPPRRVASNLLSRVPPQSLDRDVPIPLSRVAIDMNGDVDLKFHVYPPDIVTFLNQPIEFDLRLRREAQAGTAGRSDVP